MNVYQYTAPQIEAMWRAYCEAPDDTPVAELRTLMDDAAASVIDTTEGTKTSTIANAAFPQVDRS